MLKGIYSICFTPLFFLNLGSCRQKENIEKYFFKKLNHGDLSFYILVLQEKKWKL